MIIISMGGGLGNQMFEYAFAFSMGKKYPETEIKFDIKYGFPRSHNGIEIFNIFGIIPQIASYDEIKKLTGRFPLYGEKIKLSIYDRMVRKLHFYPRSLWIQRDYTQYYDIVNNLDSSKSYYMYGPFANYRYFRDYGDEIVRRYHFPEVSGSNKKYENEIKKSNSVSIHIRRGDYVKEGIQLAGDDYYNKAISIINKKIDNPKFFVFSDEIEYSRKLLKDYECVFVEGNTKSNSFIDMQLMSMCKHNIIANSTFSFWGGYLNNNVNKIVIAPNLPFSGCSCAFTCDEWINI